jgi:hypothetical protein
MILLDPDLDPSDLRDVSNFSIGPGPVNVSNQAGDQTEPAIAKDPTDPTHNRLFIVSNQNVFATGLFFARSTDRGATWQTGYLADGSDGLPEACCDGTVSWDEFGNLFLGYLELDANGDAFAVVAVSTNQGLSFQTVARMECNDQPTVVTGPGGGAGPGSVWVLFNDRNSDMVVSAAIVTGLGAISAFSPAAVAPGSNTMNFGDIAVGPDGQVVVIYQNNDGDEGPDGIFGNIDQDGLVGGINLSPRITITATNVGDFDFIPAQPNRSVDAEANMAFDRSGGQFHGRVYMTYTDESPDESDDLDIFLRFSDDNGQTWSSPTRVNNDGTTNSQFMPKVAVDQYTGFVAASWYDARFDDGMLGPDDTDGTPNTDVEYHAAVSFNGGACFSENIRVIASPSNAVFGGDGLNDYGDYSALVYDAGVMHPTWIDNSVQLTRPGLTQFDVATVAITVPTLNEEDRFEPGNDTSERATEFDTIFDSASIGDLSITSHQSGLPDYDWYRFEAGLDGTFQVSLTGSSADGILELWLYTLAADNTLIPLGDSRGQSQLCNQVYTLTAAVRRGDPLLIQVKGTNPVPGLHSRGNYALEVRLT